MEIKILEENDVSIQLGDVVVFNVNNPGDEVYRIPTVCHVVLANLSPKDVTKGKEIYLIHLSDEGEISIWNNEYFPSITELQKYLKSTKHTFKVYSKDLYKLVITPTNR